MSTALDDTLEIGALLAQVLPTLVSLYDKIATNNQNAGLVPAATLLSDVVTVSSAMETTAEAQIAAIPVAIDISADKIPGAVETAVGPEISE